MYCPRCGDTNHDSDRFCSFCGQDLSTYRRLWPGAAVPGAAPVAAGAPPAPGPQTTPPSAPAASSFAKPQATACTTEAPQISSYLGWAAVLLTLCWPAFWAGITALVYAGRTESRLAAGDMAGARQSSLKAKSWCWVTFVAGLLLWVAALVLLVTL
jgi:hypothetical protein